ncbi:DUF3530 family protein [Marinobacter arenosus]|uniref:DUF3530 family protein n=1 Tax=Marinobacter arenosus TaxID=2856822 RepID=UPI001C4C3D6E|nr:DUF3530 family protein [Marinobacter arenosus]MBW0147674.1 alpha/beta hydrolase family protein [Marinobacter arenosus]
MRRIGSGALKQLLSLLSALFWLGCPVVVAADESAADTGQEDSGSAPDRSGFTTGLGEMALSEAFPEAAVWLELEDGDRALGLFFPERASPAPGALVLLADVGGNAASGILGILSAQLTERGWAVLAVGLPAPPLALQQALEARPGSAGPAADDDRNGDDSAVMIDVMASPDGQSPEQRYRGRVRQSLEAAIDVLAARGYDRPVLLGVGHASGHLVRVQQDLSNPGIMIWVAPEFYPRDAATLPKDLSAAGSGVLELYASRVSANEEVRRRWAALDRAGAYQRQPVSLQQPPSPTDAPGLAGRIDAWLRSR